MHIRWIAALVAALLAHPLLAVADETDANASASAYFARACADGIERVGVYAPATRSFSDITDSASSGAFSWDRLRFEQLCALPQLYVYHCHTTNDVLTRFPSGSKDGLPGDFGAAAEMEFTCATTAVLHDHSAPSLIHGLVTPRGEITKYGFTAATLDTIQELGRSFGHMLKSGASRGDVAHADAEAQLFFGELNAEYFARFIRFAIKTCPDGAIDHCNGFTLERFANTWSGDDRIFVRAGKREGLPALAQSASSPGNPSERARAEDRITELTPETLGEFVSEGKVMVSICSDATEGLRPRQEASERMIRLAGSCPHIRMGILDQDKHPTARYVYPVAKDRSLLLFKTNRRSGLNEQFNLTTTGDPTPQMIGMVLCDKTPFDIPFFFQ
jgi:hypothetical protein